MDDLIRGLAVSHARLVGIAEGEARLRSVWGDHFTNMILNDPKTKDRWREYLPPLHRSTRHGNES